MVLIKRVSDIETIHLGPCAGRSSGRELEPSADFDRNLPGFPCLYVNMFLRATSSALKNILAYTSWL